MRLKGNIYGCAINLLNTSKLICIYNALHCKGCGFLKDWGGGGRQWLDARHKFSQHTKHQWDLMLEYWVAV